MTIQNIYMVIIITGRNEKGFLITESYRNFDIESAVQSFTADYPNVRRFTVTIGEY